MLVSLIPFFYFGILASQTIKGKVTDKNGVIPFANVIIKNNNKIIAGTTTTDLGTFQIAIKKGSYILEISFLGYKTFTKEIEVDANLNLTNILLKENSQDLNEIVIKTEKRILERKIDRMVFNVEKSIAATGGNGVDILKVTPGIQMQNNTLSILGKGATQVMLNGRLSPLKNEELINFLNGFSANDILKIEVITNPPAKYDAAGNGGLINIVLKKGILNSWKNNTTISFNQNKYNFTTLNNNFFYNKNKISLSASINTTKGDIENLEGIAINYPDNFWNIDVIGKMGKDQLSGRFLMDYAISKNTTFGMQYLANKTNPDIISKTISTIFNTDNDLERSLENNANNLRDNQNQSINFHVISKLDSLGKKISFDADYFIFKADNTLDFTTEQFNNSGNSQGNSSAALNISNQNIENFSGQIDVDFPLKKLNLSYGIKASFTKSLSDVLYYDTLSNEPTLDPTKSNAFNYKENVLAAYFSGNSKLSDKVNMQFGLRFEDTKTNGINAEINEINKNNYNKLFPSIYLSYIKNDTNNFGFSYGKRINRPNFRDLNPFRFYINDNSYSVGNPFLQPSFSDNFEVNHIYKNNLSSSFSMNITKNGYSVIFNTDAQNQDQIVTRENYFKTYTYSLKESFSFNKVSWWKSQISINAIGYVTKFNKDIGTNPKNGVQLYVTSNNSFSLNKNTILQVNSWYSSTHKRGLYSMGEMFDVSIGLQHSFKNNIKMSLLFSDVTNTASLNNYISSVNGIEQNYRQNESSRNFRISLSYNFGNKKVNVKNRSFSNDDAQRRSN